MIQNSRKQPISCQHNAILWLTKHDFSEHIYLDTFRQTIMVTGGTLSDELIIELVRQMEDSCLMHWAAEHVRSAVVSLAVRHASLPCTTWLDQLKWDRKNRLWKFFTEVYGAEDSEYSAMCGQVLFVSAVARAVSSPRSCKADVMVVSIGTRA